MLIFNDLSDAGRVDIGNAVGCINYMMGAGYFGYKYTFVNDVSHVKPLTGNIRDLYEEEKVRILNEANNLAKEIIINNVELINMIYKIYEMNNCVTKEEFYNLINKNS